MRRTRIYVAGAISANNGIDFLRNITKGLRATVDLIFAGYSPFPTFADFIYQLVLKVGESIGVEVYYEVSMAWLYCSDAVFVLPDSHNSKGTKNELIEARKEGIPVYYDLKQLQIEVPKTLDKKCTRWLE